MNSDSMQHLSEDQIIQAVVDMNDLPQTLQLHLAECSQCLADKNGFEREMALLGQQAKRLAPDPRRRIILPAPKSRNVIGNLLDWRNLTAAAATVAAVFILVWGTNLVRNLSDPEPSRLAAEMVEAEILMTEVNTLVDNALPPFYLEISGENNAAYDDEFFQFLIPNTEDNTLTSDRGKKGTSLC